MVSEHGYYVPPDEQDDVVQEILIHVYRAVVAPDFEVEHGFDALVRSVAHRRCVDWLRRHRPAEPLKGDAPSSTPNPESEALTREKRQIVARILRSLSDSCLEVLRLRLVEGLSYRAIAERLGRTEGGVRSQMYKCLRRASEIYRAGGERGTPFTVKDPE
jgi:RNA polymerase sigma-70 factor (ECF subfamily)